MPASMTCRESSRSLNEVITNSTAVWFDTLDDLRGCRRWFEARQVRGFPILVAVEDGSVPAMQALLIFERGTVIVTRSSIPST